MNIKPPPDSPYDRDAKVNPTRPPWGAHAKPEFGLAENRRHEPPGSLPKLWDAYNATHLPKPSHANHT